MITSRGKKRTTTTTTTTIIIIIIIIKYKLEYFKEIIDTISAHFS
jgi:hypothetical protein